MTRTCVNITTLVLCILLVYPVLHEIFVGLAALMFIGPLEGGLLLLDSMLNLAMVVTAMVGCSMRICCSGCDAKCARCTLMSAFILAVVSAIPMIGMLIYGACLKGDATRASAIDPGLTCLRRRR